jgi:hypothetical protein
MNECIYVKIQNLKYFILEMGLGNAERPHLTVAQMEDRQGRNLVLVAGEIRRHSS